MQTDQDNNDDNENGRDDFELLVQQALDQADPVPPSVSTIAKLAYDFRNFEVVEPDGEVDMALARSTATDTQHRYSRGDAVFSWSLVDGTFVGNVVNISSLELQTRDEIRPVRIDDFGAFEVPAVDEPFRWIVEKSWATTWSAGL